MRGNYRHNSINKKRIGKIILAVFVAYIAVVVLRGLIGGVVSITNNSVLNLSFWLFDSEGSFPAYFRNRNELVEEINGLKAELSVLAASNITIKNLQHENVELRHMVHSSSSPRVLASVIARPPQLPHDSLLLDVGETDGVPEGAVVYLGRDKAIGVVVRVFSHSSLAKLVSSPKTVSTVYIVGPNIYTSAVGMGGGILQVNVPQGVTFDRGNLVTVPALGSGVYGEIEEVVSIPTEPVQYGFVTNTVPTQSLRSVTVSLEAARKISFEEAEVVVDEMHLSLLEIEVPDHALVEATTSATSSIGDVVDELVGESVEEGAEID